MKTLRNLSLCILAMLMMLSPLMAQDSTATTKPVLVYPNSGEQYDAGSKGWRGVHLPERLFFYRMHSDNISSIGKKILSEDFSPLQDRLLKGYWPLANDG